MDHTATLVVTTATSLIATPSSSTFGQTVNLQTTVTSGFGTPTGPVHFLDGSTELGSAELVRGQASFDVATLSIGSHTLKAVYAGDGISIGSESPVVTQTVSGSTSSTSLSLSPNPSQSGSAVTMSCLDNCNERNRNGHRCFQRRRKANCQRGSCRRLCDCKYQQSERGSASYYRDLQGQREHAGQHFRHGDADGHCGEGWHEHDVKLKQQSIDGAVSR